MRNRYHRIIFLVVLFGLLAVRDASGMVIEPMNSFIVEFMADGKMAITTNVSIPEKSVETFVRSLGLDTDDLDSIGEMFETIVKNSLDEQIRLYRTYEGYPKHQAELADIEKYELSGEFVNNAYRFRYRMFLKSRQYMKMIDPTFKYREGDRETNVSIMLHFPFPDIQLTKKISTLSLAPKSMQYVVVLPQPIVNSRQELGDIPGFLSATAYSAAFVMEKDDYRLVHLTGRIGGELLPEGENQILINLNEDRSCEIKFICNVFKDDLTEAIKLRGISKPADGMNIVGDELEGIASLFLPAEVGHTVSVQVEEFDDALVYTVHVDIPDFLTVNELDIPFEYGKIGDLTFLRIPLTDRLHPGSLTFFKGCNIWSVPVTYEITMPGRISGVNELRALRIPFDVTGNKIRFYVEYRGFKWVTVGSDSFGM